jgi:hypothetical protein
VEYRDDSVRNASVILLSPDLMDMLVQLYDLPKSCAWRSGLKNDGSGYIKADALADFVFELAALHRPQGATL